MTRTELDLGELHEALSLVAEAPCVDGSRYSHVFDWQGTQWTRTRGPRVMYGKCSRCGLHRARIDDVRGDL